MWKRSRTRGRPFDIYTAIGENNNTCISCVFNGFKYISNTRRDVLIGVPLDLSTPTGMSCIGTYGENCKSDNVSKYRVLLVAFLLLWQEN